MAAAAAAAAGARARMAALGRPAAAATAFPAGHTVRVGEERWDRARLGGGQRDGKSVGGWREEGRFRKRADSARLTRPA